MLGRRTVRQNYRFSAGIVARDHASCGFWHLRSPRCDFSGVHRQYALSLQLAAVRLWLSSPSVRSVVYRRSVGCRGAMDRRKFCLLSVAATISGAAAGAAPGKAGGAAAGGAAAGGPAAGQTGAVTPATSAPSVRLYKFIYDDRYSAGRAFGVAAELADSIAGTVPIGGDITALWSRDLRRQWSIGGGAIAGMTTDRTLFCLEQLAKDHWMRVVIRARHAISGYEATHRLTASEPVIARMRSALLARDWPMKMPSALATCRGADGAPRVTCVVGAACDHRFGVADEKLVSFVIA